MIKFSDPEKLSKNVRSELMVQVIRSAFLTANLANLVIFQNYAIFVQLDESDELDKIIHA